MPGNRRILSISFVVFVISLVVAATIPYEDYQRALWPILLGYLGLSLVRYFFYFLGVALNELKERSVEKKPNDIVNYPAVSIIVPAYNEAKVIRDALLSLTKLNYPNYEIVVVDDGSTDETYNIAKQVAFESQHVLVTVIKKYNGGKSTALNIGIQNSSSSLIMCVDADSRIHPDSLKLGVRHFDDPEVETVAGFVKVVNADVFILKCQQIEYMVGLNFVRSAYSYFGMVPIVPGPVGLFRRKTLLQCRGYTRSKNNFAEDAELSLRIISLGGKIVSEPNMIAYTEAPNQWGPLLRQRYRWTRGTFQAIRSSWAPIMSGDRVAPKLLIMHLLFESWIIPLVNLCLVTLFLGIWLRLGMGSFFTVWMGMILAIEVLVTAVAVSRTDKFVGNLFYSILSKFTYDILLMFWKIISLYDEWTDKEMDWDKLTRTGDLAERKNAS